MDVFSSYYCCVAIIPNLRGLNNAFILPMFWGSGIRDALVWAVLTCSHSCDHSQMSDGASAISRVQLAWSIQGKSFARWYLVLAVGWQLGCAVDQSGYSWPLQHGNVRLARLPTGCLDLPKANIPWGQGRCCVTVKEIASKVTQLHFLYTLVAKPITASSNSRWKNTDPTSHWEGSQRLWGPYFINHHIC